MKFLINTLTHWDEPPRARHQVAYALAKNHKVVFVTANQTGFPRLKIIHVNENLSLITPYFPIDNRIRYRMPGLNEIYQFWLFRKLKMYSDEHVVINFDFTATVIFRFFKNIIYYCNDSFTAQSRHINPAIIARYHKYCESKVATKAVFCIAVSALLRANLLKHNPNSFEIPLGGPDMDEFSIDPERSISSDEIIQVGLVGFIKLYNISSKAVNYLLEDENIRITLIGPVEQKFLDQIERKDKLILKGILTGRQLYDEINKFDVAIAPYAKRLTQDDNSGVGTGNKMYQYIAMGKPVVISNMAGLKYVDLPDGFLYIAKSEDEFPDLVHKAIIENTSSLINQRLIYSRNNTWNKRMDNLSNYIKKYIKLKD